jgi:hypothetical protein
LVGASQKKSIFDAKKIKMNFLYKEKENSPNQHCLSSQDANMGTIWSHLNKLCHGCGYN